MLSTIMTDPTKDIDFHKRRRRVTKASLTKLGSKLTELEAVTSGPDALRLAQNLASKLKTLDVEFKAHQLAIIKALEHRSFQKQYWVLID